MSAGSIEDRRQLIAVRPEEADTQQFSAILTAAPADAGTVDQLCDEFRQVCESAVDPLEIASALEFDGLNDGAVAARYEMPDIFALADEMYQRVPRRPAEPPPEPDPWQYSKLRPLLHSMLYGLPAVCFPAAGFLLHGPGVLTVLIVSLLVSWSLSQGVAYLGYRRLSEADPVRVRRLLRVALAEALAAQVLAVTLTAMLTHSHTPVLLVGVGEGAYMLGASVMLVIGAERFLLLALAPGVLGSAAFLAAGRPVRLEHWAWAALAATPVLALVLAVIFTRRSRGPHSGPLVTLAELRAALPTAAFGLVAAGLLTFPAAAAVYGHRGINTGALLAALPLSLSMGAAEWSLLWYRRRTQRLLRTSTELRAFGRQARLLLTAAVCQYAACALALILAVVVVATAAGLITYNRSLLPEVAVYLALGGAMFLALLLQTLGDRAFALTAAAVALAAELAFRNFGVPAQLVICTALFGLLAAYAARELTSTMRHAF